MGDGRWGRPRARSSLIDARGVAAVEVGISVGVVVDESVHLSMILSGQDAEDAYSSRL